jgi:hypothetical protein
MIMSILVQYISSNAEKLNDDTVSQLLQILFGIELNKAEKDGKVCYTFKKERPVEKPAVSPEEKKA